MWQGEYSGSWQINRKGSMNVTYQVIKNNEGSKIRALELCDQLAGDWQIMSAVAAGSAVHYILGEFPMPSVMLTEQESLELLRDNIAGAGGPLNDE